jgi:hypothetical protein
VSVITLAVAELVLLDRPRWTRRGWTQGADFTRFAAVDVLQV